MVVVNGYAKRILEVESAKFGNIPIWKLFVKMYGKIKLALWKIRNLQLSQNKHFPWSYGDMQGHINFDFSCKLNPLRYNGKLILMTFGNCASVEYNHLFHKCFGGFSDLEYSGVLTQCQDMLLPIYLEVLEGSFVLIRTDCGCLDIQCIMECLV